MTQIILKLNNNKECLQLKRGFEEPRIFWIEIVNLKTGELKETSHHVSDWKEAVGLLELYRWDQFDIDYVDVDHVDLIKVARGPINASPRKRILEIYDLFLQGDELKKNEILNLYGISESTLSNDLKVIREVLNDRDQTIHYDVKDNVYRLNVLEGNNLNKSDLIAILLIIYTSRAFNKEELSLLKRKLTQFVSKNTQLEINRFINTFDLHYEPIQLENTIDMIKDILTAIQHKRVLSFRYQKEESKYREVVPYSLTFHKGIFYLLAFKKDNLGQLLAWRFDRITKLTIKEEQLKFDGNHIEIGNHLKRAAWMFSGSPEKVKLKIKEGLLEYLCREFHLVTYTAPVDGWMDVELEVNGLDAITFWVMQQAENVEVLGPIKLRQRVIEKISKMYELYTINNPLV